MHNPLLTAKRGDTLILAGDMNARVDRLHFGLHFCRAETMNVNRHYVQTMDWFTLVRTSDTPIAGTMLGVLPLQGTDGPRSSKSQSTSVGGRQFVLNHSRRLGFGGWVWTMTQFLEC